MLWALDTSVMISTQRKVTLKGHCTKTLWNFLQNQKSSQYDNVIFRKERERKQIFKILSFLHWPSGKGFVSENFTSAVAQGLFYL